MRPRPKPNRTPNNKRGIAPILATAASMATILGIGSAGLALTIQYYYYGGLGLDIKQVSPDKMELVLSGLVILLSLALMLAAMLCGGYFGFRIVRHRARYCTLPTQRLSQQGKSLSITAVSWSAGAAAAIAASSLAFPRGIYRDLVILFFESIIIGSSAGLVSTIDFRPRHIKKFIRYVTNFCKTERSAFRALPIGLAALLVFVFGWQQITAAWGIGQLLASGNPATPMIDEMWVLVPQPHYVHVDPISGDPLKLCGNEVREVLYVGSTGSSAIVLVTEGSGATRRSFTTILPSTEYHILTPITGSYPAGPCMADA